MWVKCSYLFQIFVKKCIWTLYRNKEELDMHSSLIEKSFILRKKSEWGRKDELKVYIFNLMPTSCINLNNLLVVSEL